MTVRLRASVIPGLLALTGFSLTACASQGTIGAAGGSVPSSASGSGAPSSASTGSASTGSASTGSTSTDSSAPTASSSGNPSDLASSLKKLNSLWADQGCKTALAGFGSYVSAYQTNKLQAVAAIPAAVQQIRAGAQQTRVPAAADAMNKMATDLQTVFDQAKQGQSPNNGPVQNDFQVMGDTCGQSLNQ
jgi:hypothetical protein